jgi:hypothetical protein
VVAGQLHDDLRWAEVVVPTQVDDLVDDLGLSRVGTVVWPAGSVAQAFGGAFAPGWGGTGRAPGLGSSDPGGSSGSPRSCPTGMIFVPSVDGRSHSPVELSSWEDIEAGSNVLLGMVHTLATE